MQAVLLFSFKEVVLSRVLFHMPTILDHGLQNKTLLFRASSFVDVAAVLRAVIRLLFYGLG